MSDCFTLYMHPHGLLPYNTNMHTVTCCTSNVPQYHATTCTWSTARSHQWRCTAGLKKGSRISGSSLSHHGSPELTPHEERSRTPWLSPHAHVGCHWAPISRQTDRKTHKHNLEVEIHYLLWLTWSTNLSCSFWEFDWSKVVDKHAHNHKATQLQ